MAPGKRPDRSSWTPVVVEAVFVGLVVVALIAFAVWFFFFAGSPLPKG